MATTLSFQFYDLPLKHPFTISRYTVTIQKTVVVCISDGTISGYGEATVNPYYHSTVGKLTNSLSKIQNNISLNLDLHPKNFWQQIAPLLQDDYFALCAIDLAYWDFYAQKNNKTVRSFWANSDNNNFYNNNNNNNNNNTPRTSYTIGIDSVEIMQQKIAEMPWPIYKIKLGTDYDIQIIEKLRKTTGALFRIDANCAWTAKQTIENSKILKDLNVEFIEQPLPASDLEGKKLVKEHSVLPIIADESCQREEDVLLCKNYFHGINIKLMKCGGITPALRMIEIARKNNLKIMAGCMTESSVGISGLAQIAPLLDYLDSDGALLLSKDIAEGVHFNFGKIQYQNRFGSGIKMLE